MLGGFYDFMISGLLMEYRWGWKRGRICVEERGVCAWEGGVVGG